MNEYNENKNELNGLSQKVKPISTKRLTKDLVYKFSVLNGANYFFRNISRLFSIYTN